MPRSTEADAECRSTLLRRSSTRAGRALPAGRPRDRKKQLKRDKRDVHGWVVLDKPVGMTSTHAVSVIKRAVHGQARRPRRHARSARLRLPADRARRGDQDRAVRHGRPQDSTASPCAGARSATPTTPKAGSSRPATCGPTPEAIRALLPAFIGTIEQVPPRYSAIKIDGERAYDLARDGEVVELQAPDRSRSTGWSWSRCPDADHAVFEAECGKGTYVRALARDMGRALGLLRPCLRPAPDRGRARSPRKP